MIEFQMINMREDIRHATQENGQGFHTLLREPVNGAEAIRQKRASNAA